MNKKVDAFFAGASLLIAWFLFILMAPNWLSNTVTLLIGGWTVGTWIVGFAFKIRYGKNWRLNGLIEVNEAMSNCIKVQQQYIEMLRGYYYAKQAEVDALMLEYCPEKMTEEQKINWAASQKNKEPQQ